MNFIRLFTGRFFRSMVANVNMVYKIRELPASPQSTLLTYVHLKPSL
jgi:hypothetical protein